MENDSGWHSSHVKRNKERDNSKAYKGLLKAPCCMPLSCTRIASQCCELSKTFIETEHIDRAHGITWGGKVPFATLAVPPRPPPAKKSQYCYIRCAVKHTWTVTDVRDDGCLRPLQPLHYQIFCANSLEQMETRGHFWTPPGRKNDESMSSNHLVFLQQHRLQKEKFQDGWLSRERGGG